MDYEKYENILERKIGTLSGIGVKRTDAFSRLGIYRIKDLLMHFPRAYQNRGNIRLLSDAVYGENCSFLLTVGTQPRTDILKSGIQITKFNAFDESGEAVVSYFNSRYTEKIFHIGETHRFWGKTVRKNGRLYMSSPVHELYIQGMGLPDVVPVYPSAAGLSQKIISGAVNEAVGLISECGVPAVIPEDLREELGLPDPYSALTAVHCTVSSSISDIEKARHYFTAEKLYIFSLCLSVSKKRKKFGVPPHMEAADLKAFTDSLGFELTNAQKRSVAEIEADMVNADVPMSRLLSGDVGSGKTAVCASAMYTALKNGFQAALMAPTEILAVQHYESLSGLFEKFGYSVSLLTGSLSASVKKKTKSDLAEGKTDIVIGTHALITPDTSFARLGLVVTDEQHRFGVYQRAKLGNRNGGGTSPHVLVMSATPIPRTLALILYGDLSLSMLDELPPGRQRVDTFVVNESYRKRLNAFIEKQVREGGQVYIVCPAIEEKESDDQGGDLISFAPDGSPEMRFEKPKLKYAAEYSEYLQKEIFPELSVGLIHGKMKSEEKADIMKQFSENKIQILVSTTVIEVGINVPNASLMIIENAERFGLAQLHQLRGRVGRGSRKAYCVLVSTARNEKSLKRLSIMKNTYDGYRIAEQDLEIRGPGDYLPHINGDARQHGSTDCIMSADMGLLHRAMEEAEKTVASDPGLNSPENLFAAKKMNEIFHSDERAMQ